MFTSNKKMPGTAVFAERKQTINQFLQLSIVVQKNVLKKSGMRSLLNCTPIKSAGDEQQRTF